MKLSCVYPALALLLGFEFSVAGPVVGAEKRINLLFIMTDQQRWDAMSCAGNTVLTTPNLDRLAAEGARFAKFYSSCPVCTPARTAQLPTCTPCSWRAAR
jgi:hypothetical protein